MFKFKKVNEAILLKKLQGITKTARSIADDLKSQRSERDLDDRALTQIAREVEAVERTLAEVVALAGKIKTNTQVMTGRRSEQRDLDLSTLQRVGDVTDQIGDVGTLTANTLEYITSSAPALADILGQTPPSVLELAFILLKDANRGELIDQIKLYCQDK